MIDYDCPGFKAIEVVAEIRRLITEKLPQARLPYFCSMTSLAKPRKSMLDTNNKIDICLSKPIFRAGVKKLLSESGLLPR
mmetsp:Transcript_10678/g.13254  ORF Transcript_10678/g.13254 Transcript_10678/m.13254 type:complete len:80 (-) Transcript_10678:93-332(-)